MQTVQISYESDCPHVHKAKRDLTSVDAFQELLKKPHETTVYQTLSRHLPHVTCPLYSGMLKSCPWRRSLLTEGDPCQNT